MRQDSDTGSHRFAVSGRATFSDPHWYRRVRSAEEGDLIFRQRLEPVIALT